ncbi:FAD-binding oxidoreductase [Caproiciproducens faecalis]|uniref:D-lactate dehydrogenase (cytochrome) n=1 Tax=Caproiciproducens faecalis TaxID=2820301 RepID=A0ABS7DPT8_9FIRM|nr:FAD-binding oxidoreductase [Caproiciproducens faecalis]MBW7573324.1 FAD-binding oxidoreductase [Caproiciproducens faecalis]
MNSRPIFPMDESYEEYIHDESQFSGSAQSISFPRSEEEICAVISEMREQQIPVTVQGGKTGIAGSGVPLGGHLMNVADCSRVLEYSETDGKYLLTVEPGLRLTELKQEMAKLGGPVHLFWPPEPTETSATVGGVAAAAASGICSYAYGGARQYFEAARVVLADGTVRDIRCGDHFLKVNGEQLDELDAFLGSEGMLGVFSALTLRLIPCPAEQWGIAFFFENRQDAWRFADELQSDPVRSEEAQVTAAEYIDGNSIRLVESKKELLTKLGSIPPIDPTFDAMIYLEIAGEEAGIESAAEILMERATQFGSDPDRAWAVSGEKEIESLRTFRHAVPETANLIVEENHRSNAEITKLSTDISFEGKSFTQIMNWYEECLKDLRPAHCIFGHIGENHLHCNLFPKNSSEQQQCEAWMSWMLQESAGLGGCVVTENGVGKLKRRWLPSDNALISRMRKLKEIYDPTNFWNPGNMF